MLITSFEIQMLSIALCITPHKRKYGWDVGRMDILRKVIVIGFELNESFQSLSVLYPSACSNKAYGPQRFFYCFLSGSNVIRGHFSGFSHYSFFPILVLEFQHTPFYIIIEVSYIKAEILWSTVLYSSAYIVYLS